MLTCSRCGAKYDVPRDWKRMFEAYECTRNSCDGKGVQTKRKRVNLCGKCTEGLARYLGFSG